MVTYTTTSSMWLLLWSVVKDPLCSRRNVFLSNRWGLCGTPIFTATIFVTGVGELTWGTDVHGADVMEGVVCGGSGSELVGVMVGYHIPKSVLIAIICFGK
eukprot:GFYU01053537.1.p3 GENE.GFYU01053537.1~~GFYU01053537.1.p3  ORF type:complete len:101 (-),score=6.80 GFYU01053537.1:134-436(-)